MLKVREGAWPAFLHCIFLRLWKQGLQSIVAPCQPKSKDTSTERKIRMTNHSKAKPHLSHSPTNRKPWGRFRKPGDSLHTKVRNDAEDLRERSSSSGTILKKQSQGH